MPRHNLQKRLFLAGAIFLAVSIWAGAVFAISPFDAFDTQGNVIFCAGEKVVYSIKKMGVKAGEATIEFQGAQVLDGQDVVLIVFRATGLNFLDEEKIYVDPKTFLPVQVVRNLNIFGSKEKITEFYDQVKYTVKVVKTKGKAVSEVLIQKEAPIDNIYGFIYRYRMSGSFDFGQPLELNLPTKNVKLLLKSKERLSAAGKNYDAYLMESQPSMYRVWFDASVKKIPLRIDGAVGFGDTQMIMRKYPKL